MKVVGKWLIKPSYLFIPRVLVQFIGTLSMEVFMMFLSKLNFLYVPPKTEISENSFCLVYSRHSDLSKQKPFDMATYGDTT